MAFGDSIKRGIVGAGLGVGKNFGLWYGSLLGPQGGGGSQIPLTPEQKTARWQDRIALNNLLQGTGASLDTTRATNRLGAAGAPTTGGNALNALMLMSTRGGVGGKKAKFLEQVLAMKGINDWQKTTLNEGQDQIARGYQGVADSLTGSLGPGVDMNSPAVLDAVRRYTEGRAADTTQLNTKVNLEATQQRNAIMLDKLAPTLDETGSLVESLRMLQQERSDLRRAQYMSLGQGLLSTGLTTAGAFA